MESKVLENERLLVEINDFGAEIVRIYDKEKKREILWDANPNVWSRHAPVLFPFVGKCFDGSYQYEGVTYPMTPHGFARDSTFSLLSANDSEVWYELQDSKQTYEVYPFHFRLQIGHKLEGNKLTVMWKVENTDSKELLFMIGGHPAFCTPDGNDIYDFTFDFGQAKSLHYDAPNKDGYCETDKEGILKLADGKTPLTPGFFEIPLTYIFDQAQVNSVSLLLPGETPYVTLRCAGIPYLGVWTMEKTHPFVCLEPWFGRCADQGYSGELKDRTGIMSLEGRKTFRSDYVIEIH